jgi:hypothetical protein
MGYFATSTLHPDLRSAEAVQALSQHWRDGGALRLSPVLEPGLASELALVCGEMQQSPRIVPKFEDVSWSCDVSVPDEPDSQLPECLFRLLRFLRHDMPQLVSGITGQRFIPQNINSFHLWSMRKGSYVDQGGPLAGPGGVDVTLGLTGGVWPVEWGGHIVWRSDDGQLYGLAPALDVLDITQGGQFRVPLLTRHVRSLMIRSSCEIAEVVS